MFFFDSTCYVWARSCGRSSYQNKDEFIKIVQGVVSIIQSRPDELFLIVHLKPRHPKGNDDIVKAVKNKIKTGWERLQYIHYGLHTATNEFSLIPNIILVGVQFYEAGVYEAIGRAAANKPTIKGALTPKEITSVKLGELSHHILQAACRGLIRKCFDNTCPNANLWVITHPKTGINKKLLSRIFPGCSIVPWEFGALELTKKQKEALDFIKLKLSQGEESIFVREIRKAINVKDNYTFKRDIYKDGFRRALDELRLFLEGEGINLRFIRRL